MCPCTNRNVVTTSLRSQISSSRFTLCTFFSFGFLFSILTFRLFLSQMWTSASWTQTSAWVETVRTPGAPSFATAKWVTLCAREPRGAQVSHTCCMLPVEDLTCKMFFAYVQRGFCCRSKTKAKRTNQMDVLNAHQNAPVWNLTVRRSRCQG